ncbi:MAG TPA: VCBS repeat-containing protein [Longimicrobium sp.]|nr:VCBS repeat-containing protein [Longimicrobium sp.]
MAMLALLLSVSSACEPAADGAARVDQALVNQGSVATAAADSAAMDAVRARYPGVQLRAAQAEPVPGTDHRAASIRYDTPGDADAYGAIIAVWGADTGRLVWTREHRGDFPPNRLVWLDADRDGRTDLFFTAGDEDVLLTYLFTRRAGENASADSAFTLAYYNGGGFTTLLDLDGDGAPELIQPPDNTDEEFGAPDPCQPPHPPAVRQGASQEYARLAGPFDPANVRWFEREDFAAWTLYLHQPIRILQLRDGKVRDATDDFPQHLRWRAGLLEQHRAVANEECRAAIDATLRHLRSHGG